MSRESQENVHHNLKLSQIDSFGLLLRVVDEVRSEPLLDIVECHLLALGVLSDLVAAYLGDAECPKSGWEK